MRGMRKNIRWLRIRNRIYLDIDDLIEWATTKGFEDAKPFENRAFLESIKIRAKKDGA